MSKKTFGEQLSAYRHKHRLTQKEMADRLQMSVSHISMLEHNVNQPRESTVLRFQRLIETEEWNRFEIIEDLSDEEFVTYMNLWQRMRRLGPQKEQEVMRTFMGILQLI